MQPLITSLRRQKRRSHGILVFAFCLRRQIGGKGLEVKVTSKRKKVDLRPYLLVLYISVCDAKVVLLQEIQMIAHFVKDTLPFGSFLRKAKRQHHQHEGQRNPSTRSNRRVPSFQWFCECFQLLQSANDLMSFCTSVFATSRCTAKKDHVMIMFVHKVLSSWNEMERMSYDPNFAFRSCSSWSECRHWNSEPLCCGESEKPSWWTLSMNPAALKLRYRAGSVWDPVRHLLLRAKTVPFSLACLCHLKHMETHWTGWLLIPGKRCCCWCVKCRHMMKCVLARWRAEDQLFMMKLYS